MGVPRYWYQNMFEQVSRHWGKHLVLYQTCDRRNATASALVFIIVIHMRILRLARKQTRAVADMDMIAIDRHRTHEELAIEVNAAKCCCKRPIKIEVLRFYKQNKGILTVLLLTGTILLVWTPYILLLSSPINSHVSIVHELIAISGTWTQAIIYLITNQEARDVCRSLFRLC